jgi:hypothetical protein
LIAIKSLTRFHGGNTIWEDDDIPAVKWRLLDLSANGEILMKLIEMARTRIHYPPTVQPSGSLIADRAAKEPSPTPPSTTSVLALAGCVYPGLGFVGRFAIANFYPFAEGAHKHWVVIAYLSLANM